MEYVDVIWADDGQGRGSGILLVDTLQDPDYSLTTYLFFDGKRFETEQDFSEYMVSLIQRATGNLFVGNISAMNGLRGPLQGSSCFTFRHNDSLISIIVPNKTSQLEIERDNLILSVRKGNLYICMTQPVTKTKEIEFYMGFTK